MSDASVEGTNDEATEAKRWAVHKGYWSDPFMEAMCGVSGPPKSHLPEMSRGYAVRVKGISDVASDFLRRYGKEGGQILSLGAGYDTLYWRLREAGQVPSGARWVETDLPPVAARKAKTILSQERLSLPGIKSSGPGTLSSESYALFPSDLRKAGLLGKKLSESGLAKDKPTLVLAECVLAYLSPDSALGLLTALRGYFASLAFLSYDFVNIREGDRFSEELLANFRLKGVPLPGLPPARSLDSQRQRFEEAGYSVGEVLDMNAVQKRLFSSEELRRIEKLELFDEAVLLEQMQGYYCLLLAASHLDLRTPDPIQPHDIFP